MHQVIKALCLAPLLVLTEAEAVPTDNYQSKDVTIVYIVGDCKPEYVIVTQFTPQKLRSVSYKFAEITNQMADTIDSMANFYQVMVKECV